MLHFQAYDDTSRTILREPLGGIFFLPKAAHDVLIKKNNAVSFFLQFIKTKMLVFILEVGKEIQWKLDGWQRKLEEIEKKFMELSASNCIPKRVKKARMVKDDQLADYTAEVVFDFFLKVIQCNILLTCLQCRHHTIRVKCLYAILRLYGCT